MMIELVAGSAWIMPGVDADDGWLLLKEADVIWFCVDAEDVEPRVVGVIGREAAGALPSPE